MRTKWQNELNMVNFTFVRCCVSASVSDAAVGNIVGDMRLSVLNVSTAINCE